MKLRWQFGITAGIFLAIFTLYPQMKMLYLRGVDWQGHYAYNDIDEVAYASYVRALIDGRPRKNDPYSGRDDSPETPQPESLFSIQFAAPYTIAIPARILGIGAPWAMTFAGAFAGFFAALAVFWLVGKLTGDSWFAMAASLAVFCFGSLAAGEGAISEIFFDGFSYPYFPGFRRYIPAMGFPACFAMCGFVWMMLRSDNGQVEGRSRDAEARALAEAETDNPTSENQISDYRFQITDSRLIYGALATACFAFTVYSYFYIWTAAAAWLACLILVWLAERPVGLRDDLKALLGLGVAWVAVLLPYAYLLSNRSHTMDGVQLLVHTRMPDLFRVPEYISFAVFILLMIGLATKLIEMKDRSTLFALSLALVPIAVFNQQIITGRSLQPIHYQVFIGNYVAMLALMVTFGILLKSRLSANGLIPKIACAAVAVLAIFWGFVECHYTVRVLDDANIERDKSMPVARRLEELSKNDPDPHRTTVLAYDMIQSDDLPTVAPQNVLWARHQHVFAGLTWQESKERYYQYLYYSNVDEKGLDYLLKKDFVSMIALFGWGRHTDRLSSEAKPLTYGEIAEEVRKYGDYIENFTAEAAAGPKLSYVIARTAGGTDMANLDKWYVRDDGEIIGDYILYRVKLR
ncbi:MAG: hypothetical protein WKF92_07260 [Pyrinomonadaceae bacterium]